MIVTVKSEHTEVADQQAYVTMTETKFYIETKHMKPLEMLYLHFLNKLSIEIHTPITSESLGYKWFDTDNCMVTSSSR